MPRSNPALKRADDLRKNFETRPVGNGPVVVCSLCGSIVAQDMASRGVHLDFHDWLTELASATVANDVRRPSLKAGSRL